MKALILVLAIFLSSCIIYNPKSLYRSFPEEASKQLQSDKGYNIDSSGIYVKSLNSEQLSKLLQSKNKKVFFLYDAACDEYPQRSNLKLFEQLKGLAETDLFFVSTSYDWGAVQGMKELKSASGLFILDGNEFGHRIYKKRHRFIEALTGKSFPKNQFSTLDFVALDADNNIIFVSSVSSTINDLLVALGRKTF